MKFFLALTIGFFALAMYAVPSPAVSYDSINAAERVQLAQINE